jgi:hypothetical protein
MPADPDPGPATLRQVSDQEPAEAEVRETSEDAVPVGWFPDPTRSRKPRERLWDGDEWTQWTRSVDDARVEEQPADWYHDPGNPELERLWTGSQWTDHRRAAKFEPEEDDFGEQPEIEGPSPFRPTFGVPGWYPDEGRPGIQRYWDGEEWTSDAREAPEAPEAAPSPSPTPADLEPSNGSRAEEEPAVGGELAEAPAPPREASPGDPISQLTELARLRDAGALTDEEFEAAKSKVLRRI